MESQVESQVTSRDICGGQIGIGADFSPSFFGFSLLITVTPLPHTHPSPPPEMYNRPDQTSSLSQNLGDFRARKMLFNG
jgi:hypothetical protein